MAVNAKDFSAAFFHISSLKNANTRNNTAASKQPNLFWFWEKLSYLKNLTDFKSQDLSNRIFYRVMNMIKLSAIFLWFYLS